MVPGVTYDHRYFDLKTNRGWISQARKAAEDGWITVAVDRLGTSDSSSPAAHRLNATTHSATIHQLITKLRTDHKGLPVALVGHSMGSVVGRNPAPRKPRGSRGSITPTPRRWCRAGSPPPRRGA
ncbi:alpha/beta fold hydrolase [Streptomyces aurantiacus]|nr:alpha/beta fold hydrolase [Streptomyces aurantiacus]